MLDQYTVVTLSGILAALFAASISYAMDVATPSSRKSLRVWQVALILNAGYWFLFLTVSAWAPGLLPQSLAIVLINGLSICSTLGYVLAFRLFMRLPPCWPVLLSVLGLNLLANVTMGPIIEWYWLRMVFNLCLTASMMVWLAVCLSTNTEAGVAKAARMSASIFTITSLLLFTVLFDYAAGASSTQGSTTGRTVALVTFALVPCFGTLSFLLMHVGRASHHLEHLADTDPLTGAFNRRSLENAGRRMLSSAKRHGQLVSVLMIDADRFKSINDQYGHEAGDTALRSMMKTLQSCLRDEDVVGRIGGEEFVVLLPNTGDEGALEVAERVRRAMQSHLIDSERLPFSLTISIGVATTSTGQERLGDLIRQADNGLYEAKAQGRNRVIHHAMVKSSLSPVA